MRALSSLLLVGAVATTAPLARPAPPPSREIDNVAAFARLFGVTRYFYPSDAAAELDWNRFAVYGVAQVRPAGDAAALRQTLIDLCAPLGPAIQIGPSLAAPGPVDASGETLVAWRYLGAGLSAGPYSPYQAKRTNRAPRADEGEGFATLMQTMPAE